MKVAFVQCPAYGIDAPPVGIAYLSSTLRKHGYETKVFDFNIELYSRAMHKEWWSLSQLDNWVDSITSFEFFSEKVFHKLAGDVLSYKPDAICFSIQYTSVLFSVELAKKIKSLNPKKVIIFGGPETFNSDVTSEMYQFADIIVVGEGESSLLSILDSLKRKKAIAPSKWLVVKRKGNSLECAHKKNINDLNMLPIPTYEEFNLGQYVRSNHGYIKIMGSKGCLYCCTFCNNPIMERGYRKRGHKSLLAEFELRKKQGFKMLGFTDDAINDNIENLSKLCQILAKKNQKFAWGCWARIYPEMDFKFLKLMKKAGCRYALYGIESVSRNVRYAMNRKQRFRDICRRIIETRLAGIDVYLNFIVGFPNEGKYDFFKTILFIIVSRPFVKDLYFAPCIIKKGSYIEKEYKKFRIAKKPTDWHTRTRWFTEGNKNNWELRLKRKKILIFIMKLLLFDLTNRKGTFSTKGTFFRNVNPNGILDKKSTNIQPSSLLKGDSKLK